MKKILTLMLCVAAIAPAFGQKALVDQAKKLSGKTDKLSEARGLIKQALENPETQNDAQTYFVAGKIEFDAYDNAFKAKMIDPNASEGKTDKMGEELINGYNYFMQAIPLADIPNEKGKKNTKVTKDIVNIVKGHANDFKSVGADAYQEQLYYPLAYETFMIYAGLPENLPGVNPGEFDQQDIATFFFNAGLSAYFGQQLEASADAFKKARLAGYDKPEATIYEIVSWQTIAQKDESRIAEAQENIMEAAKAGYEQFGLEQPLFVNNMINSLISDGKIDEALQQLNTLIAENPDNANLYGLRGFVYDRADNDDLSEADYRKAASLPDVDFETLKNVSKKLYRVGTSKLNEVEGSSPEANEQRQNIKNNYFLEGQKIAERAQEMNPDDSDIKSVLSSYDYSITTYF